MPKDARLHLTHRQPTEAPGVMAAALADLLLARRDTFPAELARVGLARLHPLVTCCYQLQFVVYVCVNRFGDQISNKFNYRVTYPAEHE